MRTKYISRRRQPTSEHKTETTEADEGRPKPGTHVHHSLISYVKHLFALPLALFLLLLASLFILLRGANRRSGGNSMSYQWPYVSPFKTYVQRLLRDLRRDAQPRRYAR